MMNKVALITGGATGIGKRTAIELAKQGVHIAVTYRNSSEEANTLCQLLQKEFHVRAACYKSDAADAKASTNMVKMLLRDFGTIDILIHNAGPYIHERKKLMEYSVEEWDYIVNGNLNSFFYLVKEILPEMRKKRWGRIITFGFEKSDTAPAWIYRSAFAAAKSGLTSLTKTLALEEAEYGITVNMICPGDIVGEWKEKDIQEGKRVPDFTTPVGRPGTGEDIARVISFLCEDHSDFITGSIIPVTGGKNVLNKVHPE
ncbi:SDR family oxidoreductase [Peribacillus tepidiphilus]|jgi:3-oxoacyl-[acyl-carrier protein] reductase|uniref:SDR family oxidoreductase n=1 Tax=Peribacillus tepidiphilus TaxID=2652445 RepID=UPI001291579C|nr:SDR family oxidoreductase [Peribacillus tepidiphilus]